MIPIQNTLREALRVRSRLGRETLLQRCLTAQEASTKFKIHKVRH
ncbi:hypothetical protein SAMD00079811_17450 [Scytonema sp. HK-05]|nr:hypothetical protein SAMD00079811_17450 [Scytonema sp. HK-05]